MSVFIDNRGEGEKELFHLLDDMHVMVKRQHVDSGDIVFGEEGNQVGIERKTIDDLISSVTGGNRHFWEQLKLLKATYKYPIVIIEGNIDWKNRLVSGILYSLILGWRIPFIPTYNQYDTAVVVKGLLNRYGTKKAKSFPPQAVKKEYTPERIRWAMLQCIRGIGPTKASIILKFMPDFGHFVYCSDYIKGVADNAKLNKTTKERFLRFFGVNV